MTLDKNTILEKINGKRTVITIEDGTIVGGLGSKVEEIEKKYDRLDIGQ